MERRIPTIFALLIVVIGIGATAFWVEHFQNINTQAQPSVIPYQVKITNLSANGFTVSWMTGEKTQGLIVFGEEKSLGKTAFDERDEETNLNQYLTHHVPVKNLKPAFSYYFKIISQGKTFDQNGLPYEIKTTPLFPNPSSSTEPAYGTVLKKNNTPAEEAIVYLSFQGALPLSTLTKPSGNFLIPLNLAVRTDLQGYFIPEEKEKEEIIVRAEINETATAITDTQNDSPVPTIILGKSYDFQTQKDDQLAAKKELLPKVLGQQETSEEVEISFPREETPLLDSRPLFKGKGIPQNEITIKIESPLLVERIIVDSHGQWFFRPKQPLSPGKHTLTMTTKNQKGEKITLTRSFFILESGTQVLGEATPSATLTPTLTATPTPSLLTPTPTPTSSLTPSPSPSPSLIPGDFALTANLLGLGILAFLIGLAMVH